MGPDAPGRYPAWALNLDAELAQVCDIWWRICVAVAGGDPYKAKRNYYDVDYVELATAYAITIFNESYEHSDL